MPIKKHNPHTLFPQYKNYSHGIEINGNTRLLFISGLNGYLSDGKTMPDSFEEQAKIIWQHIGEVLKSANMDYNDIISLRTYLAKPDYTEKNAELRAKYLGTNEPTITVICCQLLETTWKLEIEAIAAKE